MSGVLHPVGPEPEETYWLRRAMVAGAVLVLVLVVVALLVKSGTGSAQATAPVASPGGPAAPVEETPSTTASSPSASPSPSPGPSESAGTSGSDSSSSSPSPSESARARGSAGSPASPSAKASSEKSEPAKKKAAPAAPVTCAPAKLRATLAGDQRLKPAGKATFRLSLINGSGAACRVSVAPENFELTIFSGSDRIWTTDDCRTAVQPVAKKVAAEDAVTWSVTWDGRRSAEGCRNRPEVPRAGTYVATAQLDGAEPVQLRMILRD